MASTQDAPSTGEKTRKAETGTQDYEKTGAQRPQAPAGAKEAERWARGQFADNRDGIAKAIGDFDHPRLKEAIGRLTRPDREGSNASFLDIRTPSGRLDKTFMKAVDTALEKTVKALVKDLKDCKVDTPKELAEDVRQWALRENLAHKLAAVAQRASRRQSSEARQHILAAFHPVLIHELLRAEDEFRASPDDPAGFLEAELFEMEKTGGALDSVAMALVEQVAVDNRRLLTDAERKLAARELRRAF